MAQHPNVRKLYWSLAGLLSVGLIAAAIAIAIAEPGPGNISVAGATAGVAVGALAIAVVLFACLRFMHRITLVIASAGGPISSTRYRNLMQILGAGLGIAFLIGLFARPVMEAAAIAQILVGTSVALLVLTLVLSAFLWFLRGLVATSPLPDAPSVASLYGYLTAFGILGLTAGGIILATMDPGSGPIHVAGAALGIAIAVLVLVGVTLGLLVYLASTVADAVAVQENPAKGRSLQAQREAGLISDPGVVYGEQKTPPGAGRKVIDIEGIGPTYAARLEEKCGIVDFSQLRMADPASTGAAIGTTGENIRSWQRMIHLMDVKGIGPQYAEILVMAGVHTPEQLAEADPIRLKAAIDGIEARRKKSRVLKVNVEQGLVDRLVNFARSHVGAD